MIGIPFENIESPSGVYRWICNFNTYTDWESGVVEDYDFEVIKEECLWKLE